MTINPLIIPIEFYEVLAASVIGFIFGLERALKHKVASLRTFSLLCAGCCIYTILSQQSFSSITDPTRIAANILTGLGFIGAGVIFKHDDKVEGVTTAAIIWYVSSLGMACGFGKINFAILGLILYLLLLLACHIMHKFVDKRL